MLKLFHRVVSSRVDSESAHNLFAAQPALFSALLENPTGEGRQFLVSRSGICMQIRSGGGRQGEAFFSRWRQHLRGTPECAEVPGIRCLFYAGYEANGLVEDLSAPKTVPAGPLLYVFFPEWSICMLPASGAIHLTATAAEMLDMLEGVLPHMERGTNAHMAPFPVSGLCVTEADTYRHAVERVKAYIAAGDIFQANIARFWRLPMPVAGLPSLYSRLRRVNPAPFAACMRIDPGGAPLHILSASPERLFRLRRDGRVETRPIAGTRRRGEGEQDQALSREMLLSGKERAEHVMLVDLERNDLGRVCRPGTVEVNECMTVERYATVQHIVSNVRGRLQTGMDVVDVFRAMFPGGTITGCPKVRCMEIIHELEPQARGPYTGGIGYVGWDGSADMSILIRTFWHQNGMLHWAAGAGIVADSDPESELVETEHKAAGLLRALR